MDIVEMCKYYLMKPIRRKYRYILKKMEREENASKKNRSNA